MLMLQGYRLCIYMCTFMHANLPLFAPLVGVGVAVGIVGIEAVNYFTFL